ncbi:MAG: acyl-[acyl-carrier-protein]--UDP-N-acetylglucosamine O-acyltransferase [Planctomycetota bacterium]|nr:MAG: acyl-[acyl-carrier-protein]--UDP-N-acetylglucosamine O-acyltransferase [Planctomycetota bacterium]
MARIHPLAYVDPTAELAEGVEVGPFCYVGPGVRLGPRCRLLNHVSIHGPATIGADNVFFPFCSIGAEPQDLSYHGEPSRTEIGDRNVFREGVTVHRGTAKDALLTRIGNDGLFMACSHIAHDCVVEDHVIMANGVLLGGHVHVESYATFGGAAVVHHFTTIGRMAFVGGMTRVTRDVPPYMTVEGNPAKIWMVNKIGCQRRGLPPEAIAQLKEAHRLLFRSDSGLEEAARLLGGRQGLRPEVRYLLEFCRRSGGLKGRAREQIRERWQHEE